MTALTPAEVRALPDRELDALAARVVLGWKRWSYDGGPNTAFGPIRPTRRSAELPWGGGFNESFPGERFVDEDIPRFHADTNGALALVLDRPDLRAAITQGENEKWTAVFRRAGEGRTIASATHENPARAVTEAAVLAAQVVAS